VPDSGAGDATDEMACPVTY